jgi:hypothetical protein
MENRGEPGVILIASRMRRPLVTTTLALALLAVATAASQDRVHAQEKAAGGRIFFLDIGHGGRVLSANADGSNVAVVSPSRAIGPDGVVVDAAARQIFWTTMGKVNDNDGTIERADLDGGHAMTVVPSGGTFTPKQIKLDAAHHKLYWSDREGMRVMRANVDGSSVETLVVTGVGDAARRDARNWCVGIAIDVARGQVYWTQKGSGGNGRILRAGLEIPEGATADHRPDVEVLFDGLPEPIDMDVDLSTRLMYWTDRGDPPRGNTVNRAPMDPTPGSQPQILFGDLKEGIGIALDLPHRRLFVTDLGGTVYTSALDGAGHRAILTGQGTLTGIAYIE